MTTQYYKPTAAPASYHQHASSTRTPNILIEAKEVSKLSNGLNYPTALTVQCTPVEKTDDIVDVLKMLSDLQKTVDDMKKTHGDEIKKQGDKIKKQGDEIKKLRDSLTKAEAKIERLEGAKLTAEGKVTNLKELNRRLGNDLEISRSDRSAVVQEMQKEIDRMQQEIDRLVQELNATRNFLEEFNQGSTARIGFIDATIKPAALPAPGNVKPAAN
eukprot:TRINITY_DN2575_c0_g1_i2.p1 TRINITY_DN2575_c0_g1~~TRINITY_DN2575_c0_g1_i2.p1  ORF type:complete len:215 (+),score=60.76 TRINITY_DN2575_c0_g1_i2:3-647(+)